MDRNLKTYSREHRQQNKKTKVEEKQGSVNKNSRLWLVSDSDDDDVDEIIANPDKPVQYHSLFQPKQRLDQNIKSVNSSNLCTSGTSNGRKDIGKLSIGGNSSSYNILSKEIEISDNESDIVIEDEKESPKRPASDSSQHSPAPSHYSYVEDAYTVDKKSRQTLDDGEMLNDTVVHFYMNYLTTRAPVQRSDRIHVFNSFLYFRLRKLYEGEKKGTIQAETIMQTVARWDKQILMFEKDFLVIPICHCRHWSLVVVAYPKYILYDSHEPMIVKDTAPNGLKIREPAIIIFDSLPFKTGPRFTDPIREIFLNRRWQIERPKDKPRNFADRTLMREITPRVAKQFNSFDCGVYLLHSFEKFVANPNRIYRRVMAGESLKLDFSCNTSEKRLLIKSLIPESSS